MPPDSDPIEPTPVVIRERPRNAEAPAEALASEVTPTSAFFLRTNFGVPALDGGTFRLRVEGELDRPGELSLDDLRALGWSSHTVTLECAGNGRLGMRPTPEGEPWEDRAVSTAEFAGVPLVMVLDAVGVRSSASEILFVGADHGPRAGRDTPFARALPIDQARHADTLLALEMNGAPLTAEHGAPLRLIVPGWYGMASVKWLSRLEARAVPFEGHFQQERYVYIEEGRPRVPVTRIKVCSLVTAPGSGQRIDAAPFTIEGKAWSGDGAVVHVEVSIDGGPWKEAELDVSRGPYAWRSFRFACPALEPGRHTIRSRATDAKGNVQPHQAPWNALGYGNNAVKLVVFDVWAR